MAVAGCIKGGSGLTLQMTLQTDEFPGPVFSCKGGWRQ